MRNLIQFIYRFRAFLVFLILEAVSIYLLVQNNSYQNAAFYNSANTYVGKVLEMRSNVTDYFRLVQVNQVLVQENAQLRARILASQKLAQDSLYGRTDSVLVVKDTLNRPVPFHFISAKVINNSVRRVNNYF